MEKIARVKKVVNNLARKQVTVGANGAQAKTPEGSDFNSGGYYSNFHQEIGFGPSFYREKDLNVPDRGGALIHEAAHALGGLDLKNDPLVTDVPGAYAGSLTYEAMRRNGLPADYKKLAESAKLELNADSYRVFAGLCSGELRRRALGDGVQVYRRAAKDCKKRVTDMKEQLKKTAVMNKDGTLNVKATLEAAKKKKESLTKINASRKAGGKGALSFPAKKDAVKAYTWEKDPATGDFKKTGASVKPASTEIPAGKSAKSPGINKEMKAPVGKKLNPELSTTQRASVKKNPTEPVVKETKRKPAALLKKSAAAAKAAPKRTANENESRR
ncbi:hypothetical protein BC829DRAFT_251122 [Chytridium lagenaria]|nr:hypothetical protein BC829DRAFT_251122 [Chytridium lagenaria]